MRPALARTHLLYGEWLRRQRRPADARRQLRTACQMLEEMDDFCGLARLIYQMLLAGMSPGQ
jgi:hypothetical protein